MAESTARHTSVVVASRGVTYRSMDRARHAAALEFMQCLVRSSDTKTLESLADSQQHINRPQEVVCYMKKLTLSTAVALVSALGIVTASHALGNVGAGWSETGSTVLCRMAKRKNGKRTRRHHHRYHRPAHHIRRAVQILGCNAHEGRS
jgi:hypothetical protein